MLRSLKDVLRFRRFEKNPAQRRLNKAANIADLRTIAQRRLPGGVFDYIDGAAEDERTSRDNDSAFSNYKFKPRVLRDVSNIDSSAKILGTATPLPLICAPTGFTRIAHSDDQLLKQQYRSHYRQWLLGQLKKYIRRQNSWKKRKTFLPETGSKYMFGKTEVY